MLNTDGTIAGIPVLTHITTSHNGESCETVAAVDHIMSRLRLTSATMN
jgi:hypothetical protein